MTFLIILINLIIALTLLNVWLLRFNKETIFRGGDANSMKEEFAVYGLPIWFMYFIGFSKIILACLLILGIWFYELNFYSYVTLSILMVGAIVMHFKVKDPIIKSVPAVSVLALLLVLLGIL